MLDDICITQYGSSAVHEIKDVYRPKNWNHTSLKYDLAIVVLKTPFEFNEKVQSIKLDIGTNRENKLKGFVEKLMISSFSITDCHQSYGGRGNL